MKKIAIFGKPGNGKSTLARQLCSATGINLYAVDTLLYQPNGEEKARVLYEKRHAQIVAQEQWIIEGFAPLRNLDSFYQRLEQADTLIYIDLPYRVTYWLLIKRFFKGLIHTPEGWPDGSSIFQGTMQGFRVLKHCPKFWNENFLNKIAPLAQTRSLYVICSLSELNHFVDKHCPQKTL